MDYGRLNTITREHVIPKIVDQIGKDSPLFGRFLAKAKRKSGGLRVDQPVKYRHSTQGGYYHGLELLSAAQEDTRTRAFWNWVQYYKSIAMSNIEIAENQGDAGIIDLMTVEMDDAKSAMQHELTQALYGDGTDTASGRETMAGLQAAVDDGTNVAIYGAIDRTLYTWWQANYTDIAGALTTGVMATMYDSCENGAKSPDVIVTTKELWTNYEALLQGQISFINNNGEANNMDIGAGKLAFRATPILKDPYCPAGKMFFLNTSSFMYLYLKHPKHPTDSRGFAMRDMKEPDDQDGQVAYIFHYHQLICVEPRANGQLAGLV